LATPSSARGSGAGHWGPADLNKDEQVDRFRRMEENERVIANGGRPAQGRPLRQAVEREFPHATEFRRPGFDDPSRGQAENLRQWP
jgi:hypothetical protein